MRQISRRRSFFERVAQQATMADQPPAAAAASAASPAEEGLAEKVSKMAVSSDTSNNNNGGKKNKNSKGGNSNKTKQPPAVPPREWTAEMQADYERILSVGEECISASELKGLITAKGRGSDHEHGFNLYDGFEPSGRMHIAQVSRVYGRVESSLVSIDTLCISVYLFQTTANCATIIHTALHCTALQIEYI